jgi:hypothetical protein
MGATKENAPQQGPPTLAKTCFDKKGEHIHEKQEVLQHTIAERQEAEREEDQTLSLSLVCGSEPLVFNV